MPAMDDSGIDALVNRLSEMTSRGSPAQEAAVRRGMSRARSSFVLIAVALVAFVLGAMCAEIVPRGAWGPPRDPLLYLLPK